MKVITLSFHSLYVANKTPRNKLVAWGYSLPTPLMFVSMVSHQFWIVIRRDEHMEHRNYCRKELSHATHGTPPFVIIPFFHHTTWFYDEQVDTKNPRI